MSDALSLPQFSTPRRMTLHNAWGEQKRAWWRRIFEFGKSRRIEKVGALVATTESLSMHLRSLGKVAQVRWEVPFVVRATRWPVEGGVEIGVALRERAAPPDEPWVQFRTVWPSASESIPKKQDMAPLLDPKDLPPIWEAISLFSEVHGIHFPFALDLDVSEDALSDLISPNPLPICVACDAVDVLPLGPQVYRCRQCGYEGGEGLAAWKSALKRRGFDAMSEQERLASAQEDLKEALTLVLSAQGYAHDTSFFQPRQQRDDEMRLQETVKLMGLVHEARNLLEDAAYKDPSRRDAIEEVISRAGFADDKLSSPMLLNYRNRVTALRNALQAVL